MQHKSLIRLANSHGSIGETLLDVLIHSASLGLVLLELTESDILYLVYRRVVNEYSLREAIALLNEHNPGYNHTFCGAIRASLQQDERAKDGMLVCEFAVTGCALVLFSVDGPGILCFDISQCSECDYDKLSDLKFFEISDGRRDWKVYCAEVPAPEHYVETGRSPNIFNNARAIVLKRIGIFSYIIDRHLRTSP